MNKLENVVKELMVKGGLTPNTGKVKNLISRDIDVVVDNARIYAKEIEIKDLKILDNSMILGELIVKELSITEEGNSFKFECLNLNNMEIIEEDKSIKDKNDLIDVSQIVLDTLCNEEPFYDENLKKFNSIFPIELPRDMVVSFIKSQTEMVSRLQYDLKPKDYILDRINTNLLNYIDEINLSIKNNKRIKIVDINYNDIIDEIYTMIITREDAFEQSDDFVPVHKYLGHMSISASLVFKKFVKDMNKKDCSATELKNAISIMLYLKAKEIDSKIYLLDKEKTVEDVLKNFSTKL